VCDYVHCLITGGMGGQVVTVGLQSKRSWVQSLAGERKIKQGVTLTGCNRTGPPCSLGRPTAHAPGWQRYRQRQTTDDERQMTDNRRRGAKQY